jgi:hypothetical protein
LLVKNQEENETKEPAMPDKEEVKSPFAMKSLQGYNSIEANDDVIKLLNGLKELTFKTTLSAIWILNDMPDSEESPHNETVRQRAIS